MIKNLRSVLPICAAIGTAALAPHGYAKTPHSYSSDDTIDDVNRAQVVNALADKMHDFYVYPEVGKKTALAIRHKLNDGGYDRLKYAVGFASELTYDLQVGNHDRHLRVFYGAMPPIGPDYVPNPADEAVTLKQLKTRNYGVGPAEKLPGNIGYLRMDSFELEKFVDRPIAAAMARLADSSALIIDLRSSLGGEMEAVTLLCSYLFDKRTHLTDVYTRVDNRTTPIWTHEKVTGPKFGKNKPVYVLISGRTFSAPEAVSYYLKGLKRATLIGEVSGGGGNGGDFRRLNDSFYAFISDTTDTKTNWEGVGVTPDVAVSAQTALVVAQKLALQALSAVEKDQHKLQVLRGRLIVLDSQLPPTTETAGK